MAVMSVPRASMRPVRYQRRALALTCLFAAAAALLVNVKSPNPDAAPNVPSSEQLYAVEGWTVAQPTLEGRPGVAIVTRELKHADGTIASVGITTSPQAKQVYRAGADVPLLGSGYTVEDAPADVVPAHANRSAQVARRGSDVWLQIATFGERRGTFSNGPLAWALVIGDTLLGQANDYYLLRVITPYAPTSARHAVELADTLFPRVAAAFASAVSGGHE